MCYTNTESLIRPEVNEAIDNLEAVLLDNFNKIDCPLNHSFGDGLYVREIFMPKGSKVTSKIHKKRHPYFIMQGSVNVWIHGLGWQVVNAPYFGWTNPGTRRVIDVLEDTFWITVHDNPTDTQDLWEIEQRIIEAHDNPLIDNEARLPQ
jgi:hypothetical protein